MQETLGKRSFLMNLYRLYAKRIMTKPLARKPESLIFFASSDQSHISPMKVLEVSPTLPKEVLQSISEELQQLCPAQAGTCIGQGHEGQVYRLQTTLQKQALVAKISYTEQDRVRSQKSKLNCTFENEAMLLQRLPKTLASRPDFIARLSYQDGKQLRHCLITTWIEGQPIHPSQNPLTSAQMDCILDSIFELDKAGIYHSDPGYENILTHPNQATLIDYSCGELYQLTDFKKLGEWGYPPFALISSRNRFETRGLVPHEVEKQHFSRVHQYLKARAQYHAKRASYIQKLATSSLHKEQLRQAYRYETLYAKLLEKDLPSVQALEVLLMQANRFVDIGFDTHRNKKQCFEQAQQKFQEVLLLIQQPAPDIPNETQPLFCEWLQFQKAYIEFRLKAVVGWL